MKDVGPSAVFVGSLDGDPQAVELLTLGSGGDSLAHLSPSGHLLFNRQGVLYAQLLDQESLRMDGQPVAVADGVGTPSGWLALSASRRHLVVLSRPVSGAENPGVQLVRLRWVDRQGRELGELGDGPGRYWWHRLAPDATRAVVNPDNDIWIYEAESGVHIPVTSKAGNDCCAVWSPAGHRLVFRRAGSSLWLTSADGEGEATQIQPPSDRSLAVTDWSADGRFLVITAFASTEAPSADLWLYRFDENKVEPWLDTEFDELHGRFSPNGRWVAYTSDRTGRAEVFLRTFEDQRGAVQVSSGAAHTPCGQVTPTNSST